MPQDARPPACRHCRRVLDWVEGVGWLHCELPQYAHLATTCDRPEPSCMYSRCDHADGPDPACACRCHAPGTGSPVMDCSTHKGHRRWVGGIQDGHVDHLVHATPSDFREPYGTMLRSGTRSWYVIDQAASQGTEVVYRFVGLGRDFAEARDGEIHG